MNYQNHLQCHKHTHTAAYKLGIQFGDIENYKAAADNVKRAVKDTKWVYGKKVELQF